MHLAAINASSVAVVFGFSFYSAVASGVLYAIDCSWKTYRIKPLMTALQFWLH